MHNYHLNPAMLRKRIRDALDPCQISQATVIRGSDIVWECAAWRYERRSLAGGLAMALSGRLAEDATLDYVLALDELPEDAQIMPEDELEITGADGIRSRLRIIGVAPWPGAGVRALIRMAVQRLEA